MTTRNHNCIRCGAATREYLYVITMFDDYPSARIWLVVVIPPKNMRVNHILIVLGMVDNKQNI